MIKILNKLIQINKKNKSFYSKNKFIIELKNNFKNIHLTTASLYLNYKFNKKISIE